MAERMAERMTVSRFWTDGLDVWTCSYYVHYVHNVKHKMVLAKCLIFMNNSFPWKASEKY